MKERWHLLLCFYFISDLLATTIRWELTFGNYFWATLHMFNTVVIKCTYYVGGRYDISLGNSTTYPCVNPIPCVVWNWVILTDIRERSYWGAQLNNCILILSSVYTGWPKKVSHYSESSLNRIQSRQCSYISHQLWVKKWAKECYKFVLNILCVLICDVISFCV